MTQATGEVGEGSFAAFYRRAWPPAVRWAMALTGDRSLAEEVAQEAFLRVERRFNGLDNADGYLRVAVVNAARSAMRSASRREGRERRAAGSQVIGEPSVDGLLASLMRLPYGQRAVLALRYWADWDDAAIAEALGCQPATVRSTAHRALGRLREEVER